MNNIGRLDNQKFKSFQIELSKRGWRKEEPGDNEVSPEKPYYLESMYKTAFFNHCFTALDVMSRFGLYPNEIIKFIGNSDKFMAVPNEDIKLKGGET